MKLKGFDMYLDGGTLEFYTDKGTIMISKDEPYEVLTSFSTMTNEEVEQQLKQAILDFVPDGKAFGLDTEENKQGMIEYFKNRTKIFSE